MIVRLMLWVIAFLVPAFSLGVPLPHTVYLLVPALVAVDGLSQGAGLRLSVWVLLSLLYEMVYQIPLGVFALTIVGAGIIHMALAHIIRMETRIHAGKWRPRHLLRSLIVASAWMAGMVVISTVLGSFMTKAAPLSWYALWVVWIAHGAAFGAVGIMAIVIGVLFWEKTLRLDHIFSDYAIIQTTDLSD